MVLCQIFGLIHPSLLALIPEDILERCMGAAGVQHLLYRPVWREKIKAGGCFGAIWLFVNAILADTVRVASSGTLT